MSGWTEIKEGRIKLIHHSASSLVELIIIRSEEVTQGSWEDKEETIWLDYYEISSLKDALNKIDL